MSYENTFCPCGNKKPTDTMLCDDCIETFKGRHEFSEYQDGSLRVDFRRSAATILITLARSRKRDLARALSHRNEPAGATKEQNK